MKRTFDVIGELGRILADLTGYNILLNELVQNADDDGNATSIRFEISEDALTVTHDGHFSDCGDAEADACPNEQSGDRPCDFHAFRQIGGRTKARTSDTTGAFGIGFTAVYQVTDAPEIASSGRHWRVLRDGVTIEPCEVAECSTCEAAREGTILRLPWARGDVSDLRKKLGADAVPEDVPELVEAAFVEHAPEAIIFTRRIHELEVVRDGACRVRSRTQKRGQVLAVQTEGADGETSTSRYIHLRGGFDQPADELRAASEVIDESRRAEVELVVALDGGSPGRFFATLPTEMTTGIPAHVNAEFYPASDRRSLNSEQSRGRWNELAVDAAAQALAQGLDGLRDALDPDVLWALLRAAFVAANEGSGYPGRFWEPLQEAISERELILTAGGDWVRPDEAYLLMSPEEQEHAAALESLGIRVAHPAVASHLRQGLPLESIGMQRLTLERLANDLSQLEMTAPITLADAHDLFNNDDQYRRLLLEIEVLWERASARGQAQLRQRSVLRWGDQVVRPDDLRRGDEASRTLLGDRLSLVDFEARETFPDPVNLADKLLASVSPGDVLNRLEALQASGNGVSVDPASDEDIALLEWFEDNLQRGDERLMERLAALPLFMAGERLCSLSDAMLPGDFEDPAGAASLLDMRRLGKFRPFLVRLGATTLTFEKYLREVVPEFVPDDEADVEASVWGRVVEEVMSHSQQILDDPALRRSIRGLPLACDQHGQYREPSHVYLPTPSVATMIGARFPVAQVAHSEGSPGQLLGVLGAHSEPRPEHVLMIVDELRDEPATTQSRDQVAAIIEYLSDWWKQRKREEARPQIGPYQPLRTAAWLPARGHDGWFPPEEVFTLFQEAQARTSVKFLDLPLSRQREVSNILDLLGVRTEPPVHAVVTHLLNLAGGEDPPSPAIYQRLEREAAQEGEALAPLRDRPILFDADSDRWLEPRHTFREAPGLGSRRYSIGTSFPYGAFLGALGIEHRPGAEDAVQLLTEIGTAHESGDTRDDDAVAAHHAWVLLADHWADVDHDATREALEDIKCVPIKEGRLAAPAEVVFKDSPHLAKSIDLDALAYLIEPNESTWRAQAGVGAINLSEDASPELLEVEGAEPSPDLKARLVEFGRPIARVLARNTSQTALVSLLNGLEVTQCDRIAVQYVLASRPEVKNPVIEPSAVIVETSGVLYVTDRGLGSMAAARELVQYLVARGRPSQLIPTLRTVLAADSLDEAERLLDEADIPALAEDDFGTLVHHELSDVGREDGSEQPIEIFDDDSDEEPAGPLEGADAEDRGDQDSGGTLPGRDESDELGAVTGQAGDEQVDDRPDEPAVRAGDTDRESDGEERKRSEHGGAEEPQDREGGRRAGSGVKTDDTSGTSQREGRRSSGKLRSYVTSGSSTTSSKRASDDTRQEVDAAGVEAVLLHEQAEGREPEEMPHANPGFDVKSLSESGETRFIEVKSLGGAWDPATPAALSARQFEEARRREADFWLYVVEHARNPARRKIWKIKSPAGRVDQFLFDDGWRDVAERASDVTLRERIPLPDLMAHPGSGRIPFRDPYGPEPSEIVGFIGSSVEAEGAFATYVEGAALGSDLPRGSVVTVIPADDVDELEGKPAMVRLANGETDPDTGSPYCIRILWVEGTAVQLQGGNGVEPLLPDSAPDVMGLVVPHSA